MVYILGRHTARKPKSIILIDDPEKGTQTQMETLCCVHCRTHWIVKPGSGKKRGWCFKCNGPTCGSTKCSICVPYEKSLGW